MDVSSVFSSVLRLQMRKEGTRSVMAQAGSSSIRHSSSPPRVVVVSRRLHLYLSSVLITSSSNGCGLTPGDDPQPSSSSSLVESYFSRRVSIWNPNYPVLPRCLRGPFIQDAPACETRARPFAHSAVVSQSPLPNPCRRHLLIVTPTSP